MSQSPVGHAKTQIAGQRLAVHDSVGLKRGSVTCISSKFPDDVDAAGRRTSFGTRTAENATEIRLLGLVCQCSTVHLMGHCFE